MGPMNYETYENSLAHVTYMRTLLLMAAGREAGTGAQ